jgi:serine/threonine protein kinase/Tfp pilus assembly protein PilF
MSASDESVFAEAFGIQDAAARAAFLDRACAGNAGLRQEVESLLAAYAAGEFLEAPALAATGEESGLHERPGTVIGPYRLVEQIGEGGMGLVFVAEQLYPVRRQVALKLIKPGMDTRQVIARFEAERQALALMDHPNIAKVLDAGATDAGRPYFVMELVKGVPVTGYCDENRLTPRQRLELFVSVCQAVQHAHQKGIIHRDLKPSNVLVASHDGTPVVKVIDFGVAKAVGQRLTDKTVSTQLTQLVGTPLYMSPEQAGLSGLDIDTRTDIYALGVLLYELLTGTTPFDRERLRRADYDEVRRIIREEEPARPSTRISTLGQAANTVSVNRQSDPQRLSQLIRGELDWIVMKALEKDRNRRYETANAFAMDVRRYLADEPVLACPPSTWYRFRKFARRNRAHLAVAAALGLLLLGAGAFAWHADQLAARQEQDEQARLGRNAEAVAGLLDQCEAALRADRADQAALALGAAERRAGDGGAEELAGRLANCRTDLALLRELDAADTQRSTWVGGRSTDLQGAVGRWRAALAGYGVVPGQTPATAAGARVNGSLVRDRVLTALDRWLVYDPSLAGVRAVLRAADPDPYRDAVRDALVARDVRTLAALAGQSEALAQPARFAVILSRIGSVPVDRRRAVLKAALRLRPGDLSLLMDLGYSYPTGQREGAGDRVRWYQAALAAQPGNLAALNNLVIALMDQEDLDGAIAELEEAIRLEPKFPHAHNILGLVRQKQGNLDGAIAELEEAIRLDPKVAAAHCNLGNVLKEQGKPDGALAAYREAIRLEPENAFTHTCLGALLCDEKRDYDGAITAFKEAIRFDPMFALAHHNLGNALRGKGDPEGAIAAFREAIRLYPPFAFAHHNLAWLLAAGPDGVRDGKQAVVHATRACELTGWQYPMCISTLAAAHAEAGDFDWAVKFQKDALSFPAFAEQVGKAGQERLQLYAQKKPYRDPAFAPRAVAPPPGEGKP